ncbi:MAG: bifunctional precorrin-2 dehydrogenase/sirohydrochlorin ferrochelatase [Gemmatimonadaceae bacterium]
MSDRFNLPLVLDGSHVRALVVGAGAVATRKIIALREGGATVRVRAPSVSADLAQRAALDENVLIERREFDDSAIADATVVVAATNDPAVNARVAAAARDAGRLVLVADAPTEGNCVMPAVHRSGDLMVAVTSGGVPRASTRVRDAIARRLDHRYGVAIAGLIRLRQRLLAADDRVAWQSAAKALLADDFCESVESGAFLERLATWQ